ncbi:alpha/beta fold hydrolase [Phenylobacterium terrae]|uniref:Alpha/beta fold hydrolase n=1 Tax=Phenylobacterium terrae TaxID=2665495 RepID=A0ABW4N876_9CAUL
MTFLHLLQRLFALLSLAILAAGAWLVWSWIDLRDEIHPTLGESPDWRLWLGLGLLAWSFLGRFVVMGLIGRGSAKAHGRLERGETARLQTADGAEVHLERHGPQDAPTLVLIHGWGLDATMWRDQRDRLARRFQTLSLDLPGLGLSSGFADGVYTLPRFADVVAEVVRSAPARPVVLVGHSIGGMILQEFAKRHPDMLGRDVAGMALENTTCVDPSRTTVMSGLIQAMRPAVGPMMKLDIALAPLVRLMNWQSYLSGSTHIAMRIAGFGTRPSPGQLDQTALLATRNSPAVQAKGNLAMMNWEGAGNLRHIGLPVLVFIGGRDLVTRPDAGEAVARSFAAAHLAPFEQAGHMGPMELAADYAQAVAAFTDHVLLPGAREADARSIAAGAPSREAGESAPRPPPSLSAAP